MKLVDEKGQEWDLVEHHTYPDGIVLAALCPVKPKPKVIDWSKVHPDVIVRGDDGLLGFMEQFDPNEASSAYGLSLDTGKWVAWFGGECPLPEGVKVDLLLRNGTEGSGLSTYYTSQWLHSSYYAHPTDIIAFRVTGLADGYCYSEDAV